MVLSYIVIYADDIAILHHQRKNSKKRTLYYITINDVIN